MNYLKIPLPSLDAGLFSTVLWVLGLILLVLSPGGLTHNWWWSVLAAGAAFVVTGVLVGVQADAPAHEARRVERLKAAG